MVVSARAAEIEAAGGGGWAYRGPLEPPDKAICHQLCAVPAAEQPFRESGRGPHPRVGYTLIWFPWAAFHEILSCGPAGRRFTVNVGGSALFAAASGTTTLN